MRNTVHQSKTVTVACGTLPECMTICDAMLPEGWRMNSLQRDADGSWTLILTLDPQVQALMKLNADALTIITKPDEPIEGDEWKNK